MQAEVNCLAVRNLVAQLEAPDREHTDAKGPVWTDVAVERVLEYLGNYRVDDGARSVSLPLICAYIERLRDSGELTRWTVAVRGRGLQNATLGGADWGLPSGLVSKISRTKLKSHPESLGVITEPGHEAIGLLPDALSRAEQYRDGGDSENIAARKVRSSGEGLLLLYPISRFSGHERQPAQAREPIYNDRE